MEENMSESMQSRPTDFSSQDQRSGQSAVEQAKDQFDQKTDEAREKGAELAGQAEGRLEEGKAKAADAMSSAADTIRERTGGGDGIAAQASEKLATGLEKVADYTEDRSASEIWNDLEVYVKQHPAQALAGAVFAGILLGKILR
jgi:ElaB/YqjD/DUF883 family membrane-anchored ribosome-binding protein